MNSYQTQPIGSLMLRYLDGTLSDEGVDVLSHRLETDPALRREVADLLVQEVHLSELGQAHRARASASPNPAVARRGFMPSVDWVRGWCQRVRRWFGVRPSICLVSFPRIAWAALGILPAAVLAGWLVLVLAPAQPSLDALVGQVTVQRAGRQVHVASDFRLRAGDVLFLQTNASVTIRYPREGTALWLSDSAQLQIEAVAPGKVFALLSGSLSAVVAPQPGKHPMRVRTPLTVATVLGTDFVLTTGAQAAVLEVWKGQVRFTRLEDGTSTVVQTDELARTGPGLPLTKSAIRHGVQHEFWLGFQHLPGTELAAAACLSQPPSGSTVLPQFEGPQNWADDYVARCRAYLRPPATGLYQFWVTGDDGAELWLSSDDHPEHKRKICFTTQWTGPQDWEQNPSQRSASIPLETGRSYYFEALQHEAAGGDGLAVAWSGPGHPRQIIPNQFLAPATPQNPISQ